MSMPLVQRHPTTADADLMLRGSNTAVLMPALSVTDLTPRVSLNTRFVIFKFDTTKTSKYTCTQSNTSHKANLHHVVVIVRS